MSTLPETRRTLVARLSDPSDQQAWGKFVAIYAPVIHRYALRRGLQDADAADLVQWVLHAVARSAPDFVYDPSKGSFRGWLFTITRNLLLKQLDKDRHIPTATGDTGFHQSLENQPNQTGDQETWEQDYRRQRFLQAAAQVRPDFTPSTWDAFWATAVLGRPPAQVAHELGLSSGAIYVARSRVIARLREAIREIDGD